MKKLPIIGVILAVMSLCATSAHATPGEVSNVKVARIHISRPYGNFVFVHLGTPPSVRAGCSTNTYWHFTLSLADELGKFMYSQLLAAATAGTLISIGGTGSCSEFATAESISALGISESGE